MAEAYNPVTIRLAHEDSAPVPDDLIQRCLFLQYAFRMNLGVVVGPAARDMEVAPEVGATLSDILPDTSGDLYFDLASVLPACLPRLNGQSDYRVHVGDRELVVSLRMTQAFVPPKSGQGDDLDYALVHREGLTSLRKSAMVDCGPIHPIPLGTFISTRFVAQGSNANMVLRENLYLWQSAFAEAVAGLLEGLRVVDPKSGKFHAAKGGSEGSIGCSQFTGDIGLAAFRSMADLDQEQCKSLQQTLKLHSEPPTDKIALGLAQVFLHQGNLGLACVQASIACETVLAQKFRNFLKNRGVSTKKIDDAWRDTARFSQLLNIHLHTMCDLTGLSDARCVIAKVDAGRRHRNDVVHEGSIRRDISPCDVEAIVCAAEELIRFVEAYDFDQNTTGTKRG